MLKNGKKERIPGAEPDENSKLYMDQNADVGWGQGESGNSNQHVSMMSWKFW